MALTIRLNDLGGDLRAGDVLGTCAPVIRHKAQIEHCMVKDLPDGRRFHETTDGRRGLLRVYLNEVNGVAREQDLADENLV
jgi:hypothetical protein